MKACTLKEWIGSNFNGNQSAFASAQGVQPQQVTQWIQKEFIVVDRKLYSPRRELHDAQEIKKLDAELNKKRGINLPQNKTNGSKS